MNYDKYGFPIFDDEYEDDIIPKKDVNIKKEEEINIKKEDKEKPKKDKYALF